MTFLFNTEKIFINNITNDSYACLQELLLPESFLLRHLFIDSKLNNKTNCAKLRLKNNINMKDNKNVTFWLNKQAIFHDQDPLSIHFQRSVGLRNYTRNIFQYYNLTLTRDLITFIEILLSQIRVFFAIMLFIIFKI